LTLRIPSDNLYKESGDAQELPMSTVTRATLPGQRAARAQRPPRRLPSRARKLVLTAHIGVSGAWLGVVAVLAALAVAAGGRDGLAAMRADLAAMDFLVTALMPPLAVGTLVTGVILSLGTKWGVLRYRWVVVKLVLALAVIVVGVAVTDGTVDHAMATASAASTADEARAAVASLTRTGVAKTAALAAATVLSVFKPWGRTRRRA